MWNKIVSSFIKLSIQAQLRLLMIVMLVPSIIIIFSSALHDREQLLQNTRVTLFQLADLLVDKQHDIVSSTQQIGAEIANDPDVVKHNSSKANRILLNRISKLSFFSGAVIADRKGKVTASFPSQVNLTSIAGRKSFINAKTSRVFSSGEYLAQYLSNESLIDFAYPITAADGSFNGVICFEISRNIFKSYNDNSFRPSEINFTLVDHQGTILYSQLYKNLEGKPDRTDNFMRMQSGLDSGDYFNSFGNDGLFRILYYRKTSLEHEDKPFMYVRVSKIKHTILANGERELLLKSLVLFIMIILAYFVSNMIGRRSIADRIEILSNTSQRLANGEMSLRIAGKISGGELGQLADSFDQMAEQLESRLDQNNALINELLFEKSKHETLYNLSQMIEDTDQQIKDFCLEEAVRTTNSMIGYIYFMNEDETYLTLHAWSHGVMDKCKLIDKKNVYSVSDTGLWGEAIRQRKPIITNNYMAPHPMKKGYPEGHVPILRHMNIPLIVNKKIVLVAGVGNKESDYSVDDVSTLILIMDSMYKLLERKHYTESRLRNEQILETLLNATLESSYLVTTNGTIEIANETFAQRLATTPEKVRGKNIFDLIPPEIASHRRQKFEAAVNSKKSVIFEDHRNTIDFLHSIVPVLDNHENVTHLACNSADITLLKEFDKQLIATNLKLHNLNQNIEHAREEERQNLARELHDQMGQTLTGLSLDLNWLVAQLDPEFVSRFSSHISSMHISVETLIAMVQSVTAQLSPPLLTNLGLAPSIGHYVQEFERKSGIQCHLMLDEDVEESIDREASIAIFRIVQEALTNVARHADADEVAISLCQTGKSVVVEIADNGKGAADSELEAPNAFGVLGMRERALKCGGYIHFKVNVPTGLIVRLEISSERGDVNENISC